MDIGVYTTNEVLEHKKRDGMQEDDNYCFWELPNIPKKVSNRIRKGNRIFFATEWKWQGFFEVHAVIMDLRESRGEVQFHSETWEELAPEEKSERKPFQGYTYKVPSAEEGFLGY